ncbi:LysR family transcriptional regulator [Faecalicatena sp. AGMB00832]|uniref:LysR family transcriptional regulator n=1 Tax=Faecalicatena faecalis TaxID=2726362 RepID=A0ABS6CZQ7_9FIRM|nr:MULTISPECIES: LysR family transcriptional regulator [Faecalicatena]MBU3874467.1 LysR family transcriptional regulator [Faecalicatena faecalis]MCI6466537.1 LysR substrate-binding domain-containing protein [Faecalicatena sp.]MDY5617912.1 LysR substrate-binding domain-containing protein [Lachnospiraceae bacterium]
MFSGMNYVYEVYKEKSFSKAAENLYISQPALSAMIKKVEAKVGMPLFDRSTTPIQLTDCGKKYIKTAEKIMDLEDEFAYYVGNMHELKTGHLSLGGSYLFSSFIFPPLIEQFRQAYPNVKVSLFEGHTPLLEQKLFAGELDIIIDNYLLDETIYEKKKFMEEHLLLAVPVSFESNKRAGKYQLTVGDIRNDVHLQPEFPGVPLWKFKDEQFVVLRAHNDTRERVEAICRRAGVTLNISLKLNQLLTTYHLTEYGMGASFVSDTVVKSLPPDVNIVYYKIDDPEAVREVYLYYRKNKYLTRSMTEFMKIAIPGLKIESDDKV